MVQNPLLKQHSTQTFNLTIFDELEDNTPKYAHYTLNDLKSLFSHSVPTESKFDVQLFNGTRFTSDTRQLDKAETSQLLIFDLDGKYYSYSPEEITSLFSSWTYIGYQTFSSAPADKEWRWRIIIPLKSPVNIEQYNSLYRSVAEKLRLDYDLSTQQINAIFYLPSHSVDDQPKPGLAHDKKLMDPNEFVDMDSQSVKLKAGVNTDTRLTVSKTTANKNDLFSYCGYSGAVIDSVKLTLEDIERITSNPAYGLAMAERLLDIPVETIGLYKDGSRNTSRNIKSVFPWHAGDVRPSTGLLIKSVGEHQGRVLYRSFKAEDAEHPCYDLHYVYACKVLGKRIPMDRWTRSTSLVWLVRALSDAGLVLLPVSKGSIRTQLSTSLRSFYESLLLLSNVRAALAHYSDDEIAFSFSFAEIWAGISRQTASKYFKILADLNLISQCKVATPRMQINGFVALV